MPFERHRLIGSAGMAALLGPDGSIGWWCAPRLDSPPLLWQLLDDRGGASRWLGAEGVGDLGPAAGPTATTTVHVDGRAVRCWDGLVRCHGEPTLVRLVRAVGEPVVVTHELAAAPFDADERHTDHLPRVHPGEGRSRAGFPGTVQTTLTAVADRWTGLAIGRAAAEPPATDPASLEAALLAVEAASADRVARTGVVSAHRERVQAALHVLDACTEPETGGVVASPSTSLPEVLGGDRQFDYRFAWVRDASLAAAVAALVGQPDQTHAHIDWLLDRCLACEGVPVPVTDLCGEPVPDEREVPHVRGVAGSRPVRVGNAAKGQLQLDGAGFIAEAVWVLTTRGGGLRREAYRAVAVVADHAATLPSGRPSGGMWEQREPADLANADLGLWLLFDRALRLQTIFEPWARRRRRRWKAARDRACGRVMGGLLPDGSMPLVHGGTDVDAAGLLLVVLGLLSADDERAGRLVDATLAALGVGEPTVALRRYPVTVDAGFSGQEAAFLPASWWAVSALARLDRQAEAHALADRLCAATPALQPEMLDPDGDGGLGNTPLLWSHMECARALYLLRVVDLRARWGKAGAALWETSRVVRQAAAALASSRGRTERAQKARKPA